MMLKLRAATGANGTNLVQESGPVVVSIEQVLMGKKRKQLLVSKGFGTQFSVRCHLSCISDSEALETDL